MDDRLVEARTAALLRRDDGALVPLPRLYRDVVRELGPIVSGPAQLRARLRERPQRFIVLDPPGDAPWADAWPEHARRSYAAALEQTVLSPVPRVTLAPTAPGSTATDAIPDRIEASVRALAGAAASDPTVPAALAEALTEAAALRRRLAPTADDAADDA